MVIMVVLGFLSFNAYSIGQDDKPGIKWVSMEEAEMLNRQNPKKIFVDIYTDWCGWCKTMDKNTFSDQRIINYINENFYAVKLDAEQLEPISFRGVKYENENKAKRRGAAHSFAVAILQGRMGYPSVVFFDEQLNLITSLSGYRPPETMLPVLKFFSEDVFKETQDLQQYIEENKR